jgi:hypothetical protein
MIREKKSILFGLLSGACFGAFGAVVLSKLFTNMFAVVGLTFILFFGVSFAIHSYSLDNKDRPELRI